ncbi:hypothetical protein C9974_17100 [Marinobacter sp. B9-2]|nr:hypothetical protein C9974_17100 [Marinobacter sp. B9-2]
MTEGRWAGTMCLTEPQCGTDLGQVKTKAEPQADGSYRLSGTKIFISSGDHDLTENIVHIVLARLPDAPQRHPGYQPVHRAQVPARQPGRRGRTQRGGLRQSGKENGHQGLGHLCAEFRRGHRLSDRPRE